MSLFHMFWRSCAVVAFLSTAATSQEVIVTPVDEALTERLRNEALVLQAEDTATVAEIIATARGDYRRLVSALYDSGYFGASVSITLAGREARTLSTLSPPADFRPVIIRVERGDVYTYGRTDIRPRAEGTELPDAFVLGGIAQTGDIQRAGSAALDAWRNASHAKAEITGQEITVRHRDEQVDVGLDITPGPALVFGNLTVSEDSAVRADRIAQIAGLPTGAPYTPAEIQRIRNRLVGTAAFSSVVIREAEFPGPDDTLDIGVEVTDAPPRRIGFGAEIETTAGLSLQAFWMHRNAFGGAERLRFDGSIGGIGGNDGGMDVELSGSLTIPGYRRPDDTLDITAGFKRLDELSFRETLFETGVRRSRVVNDTLEVGGAIGLRFSEAEDDFGTRQFRHMILSADATRDRRDDPLNPRSGTFGQLEIKPFIGIGGSASGVRVEGDFRALQPLGDSMVLAGRFRVGSVLFADRAETPPDFLFYSGGGGTVRGQAFESLAITDASGTSGGRGFAGFSVELRRDITDSLGVVGFVDYGFIAEAGTFEDGSGHAGAGIGVRYKTGIGPLRIDVGIPVGGATDGDTNYGLYIGLGQAF